MIRRCKECGIFTMKDEHCESSTVTTRPPKFSYPDKYGKYRRKTKEENK